MFWVIGQQFNKSIDQWMNEWMNEWMNHSHKDMELAEWYSHKLEVSDSLYLQALSLLTNPMG